MSNKRAFIDTSYVYALINPNDQWHPEAKLWQRELGTNNRFITSEFILTEIADGLSSLAFRKAASRAIRFIKANPDVEIIPVSSDLFDQALDLYENRDDKDWGLTDCTSFVVMREHEIEDALTTDAHFRQAGFNPLLLD
ncbi:PIN domain-containing protein [soil metagenome]